MDSDQNMKKLLEGLQAATAMMNKSVTTEVLEAMNEEQRQLFEEAKRAGSLTEIKAMVDKMNKLNQNYK